MISYDLLKSLKADVIFSLNSFRLSSSFKTGITIDTSLIKGTNLIIKVKACLEIENKKFNAKPSQFQNLDNKFDFYIGSDESGKGDYFGQFLGIVREVSVHLNKNIGP